MQSSVASSMERRGSHVVDSSNTFVAQYLLLITPLTLQVTEQAELVGSFRVSEDRQRLRVICWSRLFRIEGAVSGLGATRAKRVDGLMGDRCL